MNKIFLLSWFILEANGFTIDHTVDSSARFSSMLDLKNHYLELSGKGGGHKPMFSKRNKWSGSGSQWRGVSQNPEQRLLEKVFNMRRLKHQEIFRNAYGSNVQSDHPNNILNGNYVRHLINRYGGKKGLSHTGRGKTVIAQDVPLPPVQFWSKREVSNANSGRGTDDSKVKSGKSEQYAALDQILESLKPDSRCKENIGFCAKMPLKSLECILHCQLSTHALAKSSTKFLFRLLKVYSSYPRLLCPTFGRVYNEIPSILRKQEKENSLSGFLESVGITSAAPVNVDFIKNAPSALFNNLVKFAEGEEFELVQPIVSMAETAATLELAEKTVFPSIFGNPMCKLAPKEGWYASMIDAMMKRPSLTDIFLRGYWIVTRALSANMPNPVDSMFVSFAFSIKLLAGVDCSIIAYAQQGKPFKCRQPPPIDAILDEYSTSAKDMDEENPYSWLVCGAHQVQIPDWIQKAQGLQSRSGSDDIRDDNSTIPIGSEYDDLDQFPNPDEIYF